MTNGRPLGTAKDVVYRVTSSDPSMTLELNDGTVLKGAVRLENIEGAEFGEKGYLLAECCAWVKDIVPIPITPEILAKNGWKKAFPNENLWKNGDIIIYDCLLKDNSWCFKVTGFEGGNIYFKFVHQLQHLLFGLGLDSNFYLTDTKEGVSV